MFNNFILKGLRNTLMIITRINPQSTYVSIKSSDSEFSLEKLELNCLDVNVLPEKYAQNNANVTKPKQRQISQNC